MEDRANPIDIVTKPFHSAANFMNALLQHLCWILVSSGSA